MKSLLLAATFICALSASAFAADVVVNEPAPEIVPAGFVWTGGYVGLQTGYAWGDSGLTANGAPDVSADANIDGWLGGVYVGYNYQFANNFVVGVDGDIAWSNIDGFGVGISSPPPPPGAGVDYELNWTGAVRAKVGYAMDRFLPYIAGGVAFADADATVFNANIPVQTFSDTLVGWTIGVGVEYAFTDNFIGRAEYRYTDFGDMDFSAPIGGGSFDYKTNDVRLGFAYKF